jgi:hypothetical protein
MLITIRLQSGFKGETRVGLFQLGLNVGGNIGSKPIFGLLKPTSADVLTATEDYRLAFAMFGPGRKEAVLASSTKLAGLLADVAMNAPQLVGVTDTDLAQIGLRVLQKPGPKGTVPPGKCEGFVLRNAPESGAITGKCQPSEPSVRIYEGQWTLDPMGDTWSEVASFANSRAFKWEELPRGKDVWARGRARNGAGAGPWSDPAKIMIT